MAGKIIKISVFFIMLFSFFLSGCTNEDIINFSKGNGFYIIENNQMKLRFDNQMKCNVYRKAEDKWLSIIKEDNVPHYIVVNDTEVKDFNVNEEKIIILNNEFGKGKRLKLTGTAEGPLESLIEKVLYIDMYERFPEAALVSVEYRNVNSTPGLFIEKEINNNFKLDASLLNEKNDKNSFWILQGGTYKTRSDWIRPVTKDFSFENYQGQRMEKGEFGGGLPVLDVWNKETGFFIGSIREKPTLISLPAFVDNNGYFNIGIQYIRKNMKFGKEVYKSIPTVIGVHRGDFYNALKMYSEIMGCKGFKMLKPTESVYEAIWCGWGFGMDFTTKQMIDMIPLLKELNIKVVTVDAGWFYINGDFFPRKDTFPNGDADMRKFVKTFHDNGFLVKLWITPCVAGPKLSKEHPEWLLRERDGNPKLVKIFMPRGDTFYLCPALKEVQEYHRQLYGKIISDWGYDGLKMDMGCINSISECYAEDHKHNYPEESVEALPEIYKTISEEVLKLKPYAILELCPCGTFPSFYKMPYYNQPLASDPNSQWQVRHKGKVFKSIMGPYAAYYGDHVERFYKKSNYASMIGVGGIPGTMFVPKYEDQIEYHRKNCPTYLTPERKVNLKKWFGIYREYKLSKGEYLNLYDIAYDKPETHVVKKDNIFYYAFYAPEWDGEVEFRGLDDRDYTIIDYVNNKELGKIKGSGKLKLQFKEYLLVKAVAN